MRPIAALAVGSSLLLAGPVSAQVAMDVRGLHILDASPGLAETLALCDPDGDGWLRPQDFAHRESFDRARFEASLALIHKASSALPGAEPPVDAELLAGVVVEFGRHISRLEPVLDPLFGSVLIHAAGPTDASLTAIAWIVTWSLGESDRLRIERGDTALLRGPTARFVPTILDALGSGVLRVRVGNPADHGAQMLYEPADNAILVPLDLIEDPSRERLVGFNLTPTTLLHELRHALQDATRHPDGLMASEVQAHVFGWTATIDALGPARAAELAELLSLPRPVDITSQRADDAELDRLLKATALALGGWGDLGEFELLAFLEASAANHDHDLGLDEALLAAYARVRIAGLLKQAIAIAWSTEAAARPSKDTPGEEGELAELLALKGPVTVERLRRICGRDASDFRLYTAWILATAVQAGRLHREQGARAVQRWLERQLPALDRHLVPLAVGVDAAWDGLSAPPSPPPPAPPSPP